MAAAKVEPLDMKLEVAAYLNARQNGSSSGEAAAAADRYMEEAFHVFPR